MRYALSACHACLRLTRRPVECAILHPCVLVVDLAPCYVYVANASQHFGYAESWWIVALLPYAIFSLFHALTFTRTTLMPHFLPPGPPAQQGAAPTPHPLAKKLQAWVKGSQPDSS